MALLLSAVGIYGVLAYLVTQRKKEIGIRIALGSTARGIFQLVIREGVWLVGTGFLLGAAGAFVLRRTLESQLFGVSAGDPLVVGTVAGLLAMVALLASAPPRPPRHPHRPGHSPDGVGRPLPIRPFRTPERSFARP